MAYAADQVFSSREECVRLLTAIGVDNRVADEAAEDENIVDYYIQRATADVYKYLASVNATMEAIALNVWVRAVGTLRASYLITTHGGEPGNSELHDQWEEEREWLDLIRLGKAEVPGLILNDTKGSVPVVSNLMIDMQQNPSVRVNPISSSGRPAGFWQARNYRDSIRGRT